MDNKVIILLVCEILDWTMFFLYFYGKIRLKNNTFAYTNLILSFLFGEVPCIFYGWEAIKNGDIGLVEMVMIGFFVYMLTFGKKHEAKAEKAIEKWLETRKEKRKFSFKLLQRSHY